jgi:hypothetical protein
VFQKLPVGEDEHGECIVSVSPNPTATIRAPQVSPSPAAMSCCCESCRRTVPVSFVGHEGPAPDVGELTSIRRSRLGCRVAMGLIYTIVHFLAVHALELVPVDREAQTRRSALPGSPQWQPPSLTIASARRPWARLPRALDFTLEISLA